MKQRDGGSQDVSSLELSGSTERARRIRDAVESALSDIILLGTEEHVRLAVKAASELVQGRNVHTHDRSGWPISSIIYAALGSPKLFCQHWQQLLCHE